MNVHASTRRDFLADTARICAALAFPLPVSTDPLGAYSTLMPGVENVYKRHVPDSSVFVHLAAAHFYEKDNEVDPVQYDADIAMINKIQSSTYEILSYMADNMGIQRVYAEGVMAETESDYMEKCEIMAMIDDFLRNPDSRKMRDLAATRVAHLRRYMGNKDAVSISQAEKATTGVKQGLPVDKEIKYIESLKTGDPRLRKYFSEIRDKWRQTEGALGQLAAEGKIVPRHSETRALREAWLKGEIDPFEAFEDFLLELAANDGDNVVVTVRGPSHSWMDNIQKWNSAHPGNAFSSVRLEPVGTEKLYSVYPEAKPKVL